MVDRKLSQFDAVSNVIGLTSAGKLDRGFGDRGIFKLRAGAVPKGGVDLVPSDRGSVLAIDSTNLGSRVSLVTKRGRLDRSFGSRGSIWVAGEFAHMGQRTRDGGFLVSSVKFGDRGLLQRFIPTRDR